MISGRLSDENVETWRLELSKDDEMDIYANHRYFLTLNSDHSIGIVPVDYQTDPNYSTGNAVSGGDDSFESLKIDGVSYTSDLSDLTYAGSYPGKLEVVVESQYGSKFDVEVEYGASIPEGMVTMKRSIEARGTRALSYKTVDTYTVKVPEAETGSGFRFRLNIEVGNATEGAKKSIVFQNGTPSVADLVVSELADGKTPEEITELDFSGHTDLTSLDGIENFPNLTELDASGANLTGAIDLSDLPLLESVNFTKNPNITSVDLSGNPKLTSVNLWDTNISEIDLSGNLELVNLNLEHTNISVLDLSANSKIEEFRMGNSPAITKVITGNNTNLVRFDMWACPNLEIVYFTGNPNLEFLNVRNSKVTVLDLSNNPKITYLSMQGLQMTSIELSILPALEDLNLSYCTKLASVNLSNNPAIINLNLAYCPELASVDLSNNPAIINLNLTGCAKLTSVDLSNTPEIAYLYTVKSGLTSLDVSNKTNLKDIYILGCTN